MLRRGRVWCDPQRQVDTTKGFPVLSGYTTRAATSTQTDIKASNLISFYPTPATNRRAQPEPDADQPLIHPALGWWPEETEPTLRWDLTHPENVRHGRRQLTAHELNASPFTPPQRRLSVVLDERAGWKFAVHARGPGACVTLQGLVDDIASVMRRRVPARFWAHASAGQRAALVAAWVRRTGLPAPCRRARDGSVQPVEEGGALHFLGMDLLGEETMFWGLMVGDRPDEWILRTTKRRLPP